MEFVCKAAGTICVVGAAWSYARVRADEFEMRLSQLMQLYSILLQLKSELKYMNSTLPECFASLAKHVNAPFDEWLLCMSHEMENERNKCFADIWSDKLTVLQENSSLWESDVKLLAELKDKLGNQDVEASVKAIDYILIRMEEDRELLKNELQQKKKVILSLSLFAGLIVVILLF